MSRALLVADSGNGLSSMLDACTAIGAAGTGLATSTLSDTTRPCGLAVQTLLVARRG